MAADRECAVNHHLKASHPAMSIIIIIMTGTGWAIEQNTDGADILT